MLGDEVFRALAGGQLWAGEDLSRLPAKAWASGSASLWDGAVRTRMDQGAKA